MPPRRVTPQVEGWLRQLHGDRIEILLRVDRAAPPCQPVKVRASGPKADMLELVEWFEGKTGLRVTHPILGPRVRRQIEGQLQIDVPELELETAPSTAQERNAELSSHDATVSA